MNIMKFTRLRLVSAADQGRGRDFTLFSEFGYSAPDGS